MLNLLIRNPIRSIGIVSIAILLALLGILSWKVNQLSDRVYSQKAVINGYITTVNELQHRSERFEAVTMADHEASIHNEINRSSLIGEINAQNDTFGCSGIVHSTIDRLHSDRSSPTDN